MMAQLVACATLRREIDVSSDPSNEPELSVKQNTVVKPYRGGRAFSSACLANYYPQTENLRPYSGSCT